MEQQIEFLNRPTYVMNILYTDQGIYLSKRIQPNKEMYKMWQVPGGKVEKEETSKQATLRETLEETGIMLNGEDLKYLFNDPEYNCDVYATKLLPDQVPQQTEPTKQGPWNIFALKEYQKLAQNERTTPTHTKYINEIIKDLTEEEVVFV